MWQVTVAVAAHSTKKVMRAPNLVILSVGIGRDLVRGTLQSIVAAVALLIYVYD